tara:strand:+ start:1773 stop:2204 length:432 start_codon:yes stop_codon:yes gene_type:complete
MKTKNISALLMQSCKTIGVRFKGNDITKIYVYKTVEDFIVDDYAIVFSNNQFKTVKVMEVHNVPQLDMDSDTSYQWIVQKIDTTKYDELNGLEAEFQDHLLEIEQQAVRNKATEMLAEKLGGGHGLLNLILDKLDNVVTRKLP